MNRIIAPRSFDPFSVLAIQGRLLDQCRYPCNDGFHLNGGYCS